MKRKILQSFCFITAAVLVLAIALTGCSSYSASKDMAAPEYAQTETMYEEGAAETTVAAKYDSAQEEGQAQPGSDLPQVTPKIIKSASLSIEVGRGTFESSVVKISALAEINGGYVSNTESYSDEEGNLTSGRVIIRVPGEKFETVIAEIKKAGELESINISGQDVTQEYVDLESRLKNFKAQEEVLLEMMKNAKNVTESIEVQRELSYVQGEIEMIKGRMNYLDNLIGYSTIDVYIAEPTIAAPVQGGGFVNALKRGLEGAIKVLNGIAFVLVAISPLLVLAGIIVLIVWASIRGRNKRRAKKAALQSEKKE